MGGLVQQPAVDGADWQHLSRRSRTTLLRPTGVPTVGRVTQTKSPPGIPARFTRSALSERIGHVATTEDSVIASAAATAPGRRSWIGTWASSGARSDQVV